MALLDYLETAVEKVFPQRAHKHKPIDGGVGGAGSSQLLGAGRTVVDDDLIVSKPAIVFFVCQIFFNFIAMCCFAGVASFQGKWGVGPSGLTGFALFVTISGILLSSFLLLVPVIYEKYDKFNTLARALKEIRVGFILAGTGTFVSLLIAFIVTISAWSQPGCKDANNDPNADKGDDFKRGLGNFCTTKKAGAIFLWLTFVFWCATLGLMILDFRSGKLTLRPREPPFHPPVRRDEEEDDGESTFEQQAPQHHYRQSSAPDSQGHGHDDGQGYGQDDGYGGGGEASPFADQPGMPTLNYPDANATPIASRFTSNISGGGGYNSPSARPSMDAYGAFSDPLPRGYASSGGNSTIAPPSIPVPNIPTLGGGGSGYVSPGGAGYSPGGSPYVTPSLPPQHPGSHPGSGATTPVTMSRTMQYADPYTAVRGGGGGGSPQHPQQQLQQAPASPGGTLPPQYDYSGYR